MIFKRSDKVVIKRGENFIQGSIIKVVKPYHGKVNFSRDEVRYYCFVKKGRGYEVMPQICSEVDLVNWSKQKSRKDKLNQLGI